MEISDEKKEILNDNNHNIKVVAGPGSGKTELIIQKIKRLVDRGVSPENILVITYTNKAAEDLEKRIYENITDKEGFYVDTFHGFCARFMRENLDFFKNFKGFKILDDLGQFLFILKNNKLIRNDDIEGISCLKLKNYFGRIKDNYTLDNLKSIKHKIIEPYEKYCNKLKEEEKLDYGDLVNNVIETIEQNHLLKNQCENMFQYIFIDEYQDINKNQERLIKLFVSPNNKIFIVGDKNQGIYGFRGGDPKLFDDFNDLDNVKTYIMKTNYRSTSNIIRFSNKFLNLSGKDEVLGNNKGDKITKPGVKIELTEYLDENIEAEKVISQIKELHDKKLIKSYSEVAILLKSVKNDSKRFIESLRKKEIKFEVIGDGGLFRLEYINELINCFNQIASGEQIIKNNFLKIKIGKADIDKELNKFPSRGLLGLTYLLISNSKFYQRAIKEDDKEVLYNTGKFTELLSTYSDTFRLLKNNFS